MATKPTTLPIYRVSLKIFNNQSKYSYDKVEGEGRGELEEGEEEGGGELGGQQEGCREGEK